MPLPVVTPEEEEEEDEEKEEEEGPLPPINTKRLSVISLGNTPRRPPRI